MFDRYEGGEQAVLVHIYFSRDKDTEDLSEFESLVSSAGVEALQVVTGSRKAPHPKYFVGEGKAQEIADAVKATGASVILFDHSLSPAQERNLEALCECRVVDRTGLILDIFAQRARTHEGKLQVELAQLRHIATRLVRGWTHLERQGGGIGARGPGETQLETDRRLLRDRITLILSRLEKWLSSVKQVVVRAYVRIFQRCLWWVIPTPGNPHFLTVSLRPMFTWPISCLLRWILRCDALWLRMSGRRF